MKANLRECWGVAVLFLMSLAAVFFCIQLNQVLYQSHAPFHDSLEYYLQIHKVMRLTQEVGMYEALSQQLSNQTVFAPYLAASALSYLMEPSRSVGMWIQGGELFVFLLSVFYFLKIVFQVRTAAALVACASFLTLDCVYFVNGGLSDFRMDLSLMLMYGTTIVWFLIALDQARIRYFVLAGFFAGTACLFRATAPVYLVLAMAPMLGWYLVTSPSRWNVLKGVTVSSVFCVAVCGWFYWLMYDYLYYYYVVWNTHANEGLSVWESAKHFGFVQNHFGWVFVLCFLALSLTIWMRADKLSWKGDSRREVQIFFCLICAGVMPLLFLIGRGAGLNPFVSMPATCGLFLIGAVLMARLINSKNHSVPTAVFFTIVLVAIVAAGWRGLSKHRAPKLAEMEVHQELIATIWQDAETRGVNQIQYSTLEMTEITTASLQSAVIFDCDSEVKQEGKVYLDGKRFVPQAAIFRLPAVADWQAVAGRTTEEKVYHLSQSANAWLDYVVIADDPGHPEFQRVYGHIVGNKYTQEVREMMFASGNWERAGGKSKTDRGYTVSVFRNNLPTATRQSLRGEFTNNHKSNSRNVTTKTRQRLIPTRFACHDH